MSGLPSGLPGQPRDGEGPVFSEPWEAQAFATAVALYGRGLYTWPEWTRALAAQIAKARDAGEAESAGSYYRHWMSALETLVAAKGAASGAELSAHERAWSRAAARTPHGRPIELQPGDFEA